MTNFSQGSAKIIEFPLGGRRAHAARREEARLGEDASLARASGETFGGAWYHEAAIQEAKRSSDR
jgi:Protein of unknown function (DUF2735)